MTKKKKDFKQTRPQIFEEKEWETVYRTRTPQARLDRIMKEPACQLLREVPHNRGLNLKKEYASELYEKGYSLKEIADCTGRYRTPTVKSWLKGAKLKTVEKEVVIVEVPVKVPVLVPVPIKEYEKRTGEKIVKHIRDVPVEQLEPEERVIARKVEQPQKPPAPTDDEIQRMLKQAEVTEPVKEPPEPPKEPEKPQPIPEPVPEPVEEPPEQPKTIEPPQPVENSPKPPEPPKEPEKPEPSPSPIQKVTTVDQTGTVETKHVIAKKKAPLKQQVAKLKIDPKKTGMMIFFGVGSFIILTLLFLIIFFIFNPPTPPQQPAGIPTSTGRIEALDLQNNIIHVRNTNDTGATITTIFIDRDRYEVGVVLNANKVAAINGNEWGFKINQNSQIEIQGSNNLKITSKT